MSFMKKIQANYGQKAQQLQRDFSKKGILIGDNVNVLSCGKGELVGFEEDGDEPAVLVKLLNGHTESFMPEDIEEFGKKEMTASFLKQIKSRKVTATIDAARIKKIAQDAELAFWDVVAEALPEIKTGDFPPLESNNMSQQMTKWIELWVSENSGE